MAGNGSGTSVAASVRSKKARRARKRTLVALCAARNAPAAHARYNMRSVVHAVVRVMPRVARGTAFRVCWHARKQICARRARAHLLCYRVRRTILSCRPAARDDAAL